MKGRHVQDQAIKVKAQASKNTKRFGSEASPGLE